MIKIFLYNEKILRKPILEKKTSEKIKNIKENEKIKKSESLEKEEIDIKDTEISKETKEVEEVKNENSTLKDVHVVGKTAYATIGAKTSVNNLEFFKEKLVELEKRNEEAKKYNKTKPAIKMETLGTEITKLKRKIQMLEDMKAKDESKVLSQHAENLIKNGLVTQWQKKPIYYFVKGLRKVALVLNESGDFEASKKYSADSDSDVEFVEKLLKK